MTVDLGFGWKVVFGYGNGVEEGVVAAHGKGFEINEIKEIKFIWEIAEVYKKFDLFGVEKLD